MAKKKKKVGKPYDGRRPLRSVCQEKVIDNILAGQSQDAAYMSAYSKTCKSIEVARANASRLLTTANVKARLAYKREQLAKKAEHTAEDAIKELAKLGFSNIQDYITDDNEVVDLSKIPRDKAAAIASVETDIRHDNGDSGGYTEKVKFKCHSKESALKEFLNRVQGLPKQRIEHSGEIALKPPMIT